ncbi:DUF397 domain-containing protein [Kitasatospora sp. CM 4170]|uniref:DUF397 domain-containing protein n=1 Tax=Kitasatospora aburaviensis TaxID=67265 RepID=A0ABW1F3S7_9ACTN|nr:DUF397 domain-containing protein [Kitasatospora sp. CM 4170]WNM46922.1 DUF397 domain-containing protein [Kitasatospora sp. CM 4170]
MTDIEWQKSSFSGSGGDCLEVRNIEGLVELRESDEGDVIVRTTPLKFAKFLQGVKAGEFDRFAADA